MSQQKYNCGDRGKHIDFTLNFNLHAYRSLNKKARVDWTAREFLRGTLLLNYRRFEGFNDI